MHSAGAVPEGGRRQEYLQVHQPEAEGKCFTFFPHVLQRTISALRCACKTSISAFLVSLLPYPTGLADDGGDASQPASQRATSQTAVIVAAIINNFQSSALATPIPALDAVESF